MKKLLIAFLVVAAMTACTSKWEYKIVTVDNTETSDFKKPSFKVSSEDLNLFGAEGWELVDVYTVTETEHPNFGNSEYVTGIRENTRTKSINFVFKKRK